MVKAETDVWYETPPPVTGTATSHFEDDEHSPHAFIYIPDLSSQTGWASHRVPERRESNGGRGDTRVGFGKPGGR